MLMLARTSLLRVLRPGTSIFVVGSNTGVVSSNVVSVSLTSFTAGPALTNDLVIAWLATSSPFAPNTSGYTEITASNPRLRAFYKVMGSTPDTAVSWNPIPTNNGAVGGVVVLRNVTGAAGVNPIGVETTGSSTNPDPPGISPNVDGSAIVIICGTDGVHGAPIAPANYTLAGNDTSNLTNDASGWAAYRLDVAKDVTENPGAFTNVSTSSWRAVTVAISPP